jgi:hypothetical protein
VRCGQGCGSTWQRDGVERADAAERVVDDHDGWVSDGEMDVEVDVEGEFQDHDADRRDGEYLLVRMTFPGAPAVGIECFCFCRTCKSEVADA